jgi:hypothetical protein
MARTRSRRVANGEGQAFVTCRLCRKEFKFITWRHLERIHGWDRAELAGRYLRRFPSARLVSLETLARKRRSLRSTFDRKGRSWTRGRLQDLVLSRRRPKLPLNAGAVERDCESAYQMARLLFGSWRALLESCGIANASVAHRLRWTPERVLKGIRAAKTSGWDLSYSGMLRRDSRLLAIGASTFGNWSKALEAAGIDPGHYMPRAKPRSR